MTVGRKAEQITMKQSACLQNHPIDSKCPTVSVLFSVGNNILPMFSNNIKMRDYKLK